MANHRDERGPGGPVFLFGPGGPEGSAIPIGAADVVVVGSSRGADLTVEGGGVAPRHLEIRSDGGRFWVRDLDTINGTFVGSRRIEAEVEVALGETIRIGKVELVLGRSRESRVENREPAALETCDLDGLEFPEIAVEGTQPVGPDPEAPPADPSRETLGRFQIHECLGTGSSGQVYRSWDAAERRWVALKMLDPEDDEDGTSLSRFLQEARILMKLQHPAIVRGLEMGKLEQVNYFTMEFFPGARNLKDVVMSDGAIPWQQAVRWAIPVCDALHYAHKKRIFHRDIKPSNLLVDTIGIVRVLDFGIAAARDVSGTSITETGMILGSPYFLPPEQVGSARKVDHRADIYSLAVTIFFLISETFPFPLRERFMDTCKDVLELSPFRLSDFADVPRSLDKTILKAMSKSPSGRFKTAKHMGLQFEKIVARYG